MFRRLVFLVSFLLWSSLAFGQPANHGDALQAAATFLDGEQLRWQRAAEQAEGEAVDTGKGNVRAGGNVRAQGQRGKGGGLVPDGPPPTALAVSDVKKVTGEDGTVLAYVVELDPEGYVIVSADRRIRPILGYSFRGAFPFEDSPQNVLLHLVQWDVQARLNALAELPEETVALAQANESMWDRHLRGDAALLNELASVTEYGPWLDTNWHQSSPFRDCCPLDDAYPLPVARCYVGCVATAMAQIINYWRYPSQMSFGPANRYLSANFYGTDLSTIRYRDIWIDDEHAVLDFPSFSELNTELDYVDYDDPNERPYICFAAGIKVGMSYSSDGSGAIPGFLDYRWDFNYGSASEVWNVPFSGFYDRLQENMMKGWPAQLQIYSVGLLGIQNGHSIVADGYRDSGEFHLNFGWSGTLEDSWYYLPDDLPFVPGYEGYFNTVLYGIMDICPDPGWHAYAAEGTNRRRTRYEGPTDHSVKWVIDTSLLDPSTRLENAIVGSGGNVYALCRATNALDPGRLFVITPHGVVAASADIPHPAQTLSWPAQASEGSLPMYVAIDNRVYRMSPGGDVQLFYTDPHSAEEFFYPTQVDAEGNVYVTGWDRVCSLSPGGVVRFSKTVPDTSAEDFCAGIAIDDERGRIYAKYYNPGTDIAYLWALDKDTAAEIWRVPVAAVYSYMAAAGEPTIADDGTVLARFFKSLRAYNPDSSLRWEYQVNASQEWLEPFVSIGPHEHECVLVAGGNFTSTPKQAWLRSLRISDKSVLWEFSKPYPTETSDYSFGAPVVADKNNMVYAVLHELAVPGYQKLYALQDNGTSVTQAWEHDGADWILLGSTGAAYLLHIQGEQIVALSAGEHGDPEGAGMAFTNNSAPHVPSPSDPPNGEQDIDPAVPLTLSWSCGDPEAHALKYDVYVGIGETLTLFEEALTGTECTITELQPGAAYLWKVIATDGQAVTEGPTWCFATAAEGVRVAVSVELEALNPPAGGIDRTVRFVATGGAESNTWDIPVSFAAGSSTAGLELTDVPEGTTHLSAKTAWNLRRKVALVPDGSGGYTADFTGDAKLLGGDIGGDTSPLHDNAIQLLDYSVLKANWGTANDVADINGDGGVQLLDYSILKSNWGKVGDSE